MYRIIAYYSPTDRTGHVVFDPRVNRQISDGKLNLKESEIDDLSLTVNQANYLFGNVKPLQTHVEVYQDNSLLFRGRALDLTREMKDSGQFIQSFVFESIQNYLQDTSQRWAKVQNTTPKQFFQRLIDTHNSQVPDYKKFTVRTVDVTNSTDNVYRYIEDGATTWDTIKDKLVSRLGGFIRVEYVNGVNYIDYLQNPGKEHPNDTPIRIGKNLQSASVQVDPTEVITQLVPLGATIENNSTTTNTEVSQPRVDVKSVNGGKDYLDIPDLQAEFGIIRKSVQWDDVHEPKILLTKARQWIAQQTAAKESWTVNAIELPKLESFKVSDRYLFNNQAVASPQMLRVTGKTIDLLHWQKSTLTIADKTSSLSNYQLENKRAAELQKLQTQQAKAQAKRAYDSRLIGTLVDSIVPVSPQDNADDSDEAEDAMPVFTLQVAEDNPDFGLKKGDKFAVQTTASGVEGLDAKIDGKIKGKAEKVDLDKLDKKVDNIQIGGRNYLIKGTLIGSTNIDDATGELASAVINWTTTDWIPVNNNTEYTWQAPNWHHVQRIYEYDSDKKFIQLDKSKWNEFVYTIKTQPNTKYVRTSIQVSLGTILNDSNQLYKFEKGNKATDWIPAPEDTDSAIADTNKQLTVAKADIKATADNLSTNYTKTTDEHNYVNSQIKQSADKLEASVASVSDVANAEKTNLIFNGEFKNGDYWNNNSGTKALYGVDSNAPTSIGTYVNITNSKGNPSVNQLIDGDRLRTIAGNKVVFSAYCRSNTAGHVKVYLRVEDVNGNVSYFNGDDYQASNGDWKRYITKATIPNGITKLNVTVLFAGLGNDNGYVAGTLLTIGDVVVPFSESTLELDNKILELEKRIEKLEGK